MVVMLNKTRIFLIGIGGFLYFYWTRKKEAEGRAAEARRAIESKRQEEQAYRAGQLGGVPSLKEYRNA